MFLIHCCFPYSNYVLQRIRKHEIIWKIHGVGIRVERWLIKAFYYFFLFCQLWSSEEQNISYSFFALEEPNSVSNILWGYHIVPYVIIPSPTLKYGKMVIDSLYISNFHTLFPKCVITYIIATVWSWAPKMPSSS